MTQGQCQPSSPLGYRLAKGVIRHDKNDGIVLVLSFPLKTLSLHPAWKPVIRCLSGRDYVAFQQLLPLIENVDSDSVVKLAGQLALNGLRFQLS